MSLGSSQKFNTPRFALVDLLRFVAAISVLGYHLTAFTLPIWGGSSKEIFPHLSRITKYGALGVELFFVISGFVILMSAHGRTISQYIASRASRIFPAFWVSVILTSILFTFVWTESKKVSLGQFLMNLTMTHDAAGVAHVDGVYWTLWVEMRFYLIIAFVLLWGINARRILAISIIWPLLGAVALQQDSHFLFTLIIGGEAPLFAGGMVLFVMFKWGQSLTAWLAFSFNAFYAAYRSTGWLHSTMERSTGQVIRPEFLIIAVLLIFALLALIVLTPLRTLSAPWMTWLGLFTYPLYLVHESFGWWTISLMRPTSPPWLALCAATVTGLTLAWLILRFVDRPLVPRMRRQLQAEIERYQRLT